MKIYMYKTCSCFFIFVGMQLWKPSLYHTVLFKTTEGRQLVVLGFRLRNTKPGGSLSDSVLPRLVSDAGKHKVTLAASMQDPPGCISNSKRAPFLLSLHFQSLSLYFVLLHHLYSFGYLKSFYGIKEGI